MEGYKIYKELRTKKEYFKNWKSKELENLTEAIKDRIYDEYRMKTESLIRDNFTCQNVNGPKNKCPFCNSEQYFAKLTVHHFKAKRNGGANKARNGVTLCQGVHNALNKGKYKIVYSNSSNLPAHIRGSTQTIDDTPHLNWKKVRSEMKKRRKEVREWFGVELSEKEMEAIFKWLIKQFGEDV